MSNVNNFSKKRARTYDDSDDTDTESHRRLRQRLDESDEPADEIKPKDIELLTEASGDEAPLPTASEQDDEPTAGNNLMPEDIEKIRLIMRFLSERGLHSSVNALAKESATEMSHPFYMQLEASVISRDWNEAEKCLDKLNTVLGYEENSPELAKLRYVLLEEKYLDHIRLGKKIKALQLLRERLVGLNCYPERHNYLVSCLMSDQKIQQGEPLERLRQLLPPTMVVPMGRLDHLITQACELEKRRCRFHDIGGDVSVVSILQEHRCSESTMPLQTVQILDDHYNEVWSCKFSPNGLLLATADKDTVVLLWNVLLPDVRVVVRETLKPPISQEFAFITWSCDSKLLLVGGNATSGPALFLWDAENGKLRAVHGKRFRCAAFCPDNERFICGGDGGALVIYNLQFCVLHRITGLRTFAMALDVAMSRVLVVDHLHRLRSFSVQDLSGDEIILTESHPACSVFVDSSGRYVLLNLIGHGVVLWDLNLNGLVRRYRGSRNNGYVIGSCMGGRSNSFIATGSEDNFLYLWHVDREEPLVKLEGHSAIVNSVAWNSEQPKMLASVSDDGTVRIWGPPPIETSTENRP